MAKSLTKAQLAEQLEAAHVKYEQLAAKYAALLNQAQPAQAPRLARTGFTRSPAMEAARAQAMRSGKSVRV